MILLLSYFTIHVIRWLRILQDFTVVISPLDIKSAYVFVCKNALLHAMITSLVLPPFIEYHRTSPFNSGSMQETMSTGAVLYKAVLVMLGYFVDKRPLQKHSKLSKKP